MSNNDDCVELKNSKITDITPCTYDQASGLHYSKCNTFTCHILSKVKNSKGLRLALLNVRSLPQKLDQIRILLNDKPLDV